MTLRRPWLVGSLVLMGVPLLYSIVSFAARPSAAEPWLEPARAGTRCIQEPALMRFEHRHYLLGLRDQVVRTGDRSALGPEAPRGIGSCSGCHLHRDRFCDRCHERVSLTLECFDCHKY
jgi:hypothetical protein